MTSSPPRSARRPGTLALAGTALAVLLAGMPGSGGAALLTPLVVWIPDEFHTGGAYTAIAAAPDGAVYLGTTFYNGPARLLVLPPGGQAFQVIGDMASTTREAAAGRDAQAKIHTKPAVAPDGRIYLGTKSGERAREAAQGTYPGGHLLVFDPKAGRLTDLGIPRPRQSLISVAVDPRRNVVYALTDPEAHLISYDPGTRLFTDRGELASVGPGAPPTRYLIALATGDVFHTAGAEAFTRFSAATGRIERLALSFTGRGSYEPPYALAAGTDGARFFGVGDDSGAVYTFTPEERGLAVRLHGALLPDGFTLPGRHYTMTSAPDGNIYYTATLSGAAPERTLFIMRLLPGAGRLEVVGQVAPLPLQAPGRPPAPHLRRPARFILVEGSTVAPDGTLYVMTGYPLRVLIFPRLAARP